MKYKMVLFFFLCFLLTTGLSFAGTVTITLTGDDPLTVNVKGTTIDEEAASFSIFIYFNSSSPADMTTQLSASNVNSTFFTNDFGWNTFETKSVETGLWVRNGVTYTSRLNYANSNVSTADNDVWPTSGVDALILDFDPGGPGSAYIEVQGNDGLVDYSNGPHTIIFVNQTAQPLPVELTSFTASVNNNTVNLNWQTATEVNNYGFDLERQVSSQRSEVNSQWEKIGFVKGNGNSNSPKSYSFTDKNLTGGTKFKYRLKQIDIDGKFEYSTEEEVEIIPVEYSLSQNYPNPFNPVTSIKFELPQAAKVSLNVYNILGEQVVNLINENLEAGFHSVPFNASALPSGTYIYRLQAGKFVQTKKMILLK